LLGLLLLPAVTFGTEFSFGLPEPGRTTATALSPTLLEISTITAPQHGKESGHSGAWDFVDDHGKLKLPDPGEIAVQAGDRTLVVTGLGFRRRPVYAALARYDLRVDNRLFLQLSGTVQEGERVAVKFGPSWVDLSGSAIPVETGPDRVSEAVHVNQAGYETDGPKIAMVGFYLGSLGELPVDAARGFSVVDASSGREVFRGKLKQRPDAGFICKPLPYQNVFEADFSGLTTPGSYRIRVEGMGVSLPFQVAGGMALNFARTYALGLYHQRCGTANELPFTRFAHGACHTAPATVPATLKGFEKTWLMISNASADFSRNPRHTAPQLRDPDSQLYPFVRTGEIDVSGGHHDAGDYSKYTIDSALLIHHLVLAADLFGGAAEMDSLGIPESGDGLGDLFQEAKWEADFLVKMQDSDGGFYFLVYPRNRKYEDNVLPDAGDAQVVWPKNTSATAVAVAALAQIGSSPGFRKQFPKEADRYSRAAVAGWEFLERAIARYGKDGAYQKLTHYGDCFMHDDELAWAACEMFLATGDVKYERQLEAWYVPDSRETRRWTWWRLFEGYGCAARSYAFGARTGRIREAQQDPAYLAKCRAEVLAAGNDALSRTENSAYGVAFDSESKRFLNAGWFFAIDRALDMAVAWQLKPDPAFIGAILTNVNYDLGCNPVNVVHLSGIGWIRQHEIVNQFSHNDRRSLPPSGFPTGSLQAGFGWLNRYGREPGRMIYPSDGAGDGAYPMYDRWTDVFNTSTEATVVNQARGLACLAFLAGQTKAGLAASGGYPREAVLIEGGGETVAVGESVQLKLGHAGGRDLSGARILWEVEGEPAFSGGPEWGFKPTKAGGVRVEVEALWPDGWRLFGRRVFRVME
jgi:hypothetical protein